MSHDKHAQALGPAIAWASTLLVGKFDKSGRPYILHPLWIMDRVLPLSYGHGILALVHDCPEDCFKTIEEGLQSFRNHVINDDELVDDLRLLSHDPADSYARYIGKMKGHQRVIDVKKVDLEHNSTITRLKGITDKDIARMRKYHASYCFLSGDESKLLDLV